MYLDTRHPGTGCTSITRYKCVPRILVYEKRSPINEAILYNTGRTKIRIEPEKNRMSDTCYTCRVSRALVRVRVHNSPKKAKKDRWDLDSDAKLKCTSKAGPNFFHKGEKKLHHPVIETGAQEWKS